MIFWTFFFFLRPAFGHGRLGHPESLEYSSNVLNCYIYPQVTDSIYDLMGCKASASAKCQYVDDIFNNMDDDNDGLVTKDEFISFFSRLEVSFQLRINIWPTFAFRTTVAGRCQVDLFSSINHGHLEWISHLLYLLFHCSVYLFLALFTPFCNIKLFNPFHFHFGQQIFRTNKQIYKTL